MARIVTLYNNKGGVSKTTTLFNLAVHLAMEGKKVLIADCDPQCNATELFLASSSAFDDPDSELPGTSIYRALSPRFAGEAGWIDPSTVTLVPSPVYQDMWLLRGDLEFSMAERYFSQAAAQAVTEEIHQKKTYVVLHRLLVALAEANGFDYLLCDVGPSTGAITQMVVLACDGFFVPLTPDRFCSQAVRVLGRVVGDWIARHETVAKAFAPFGLEPFAGRPVLLGAIIQNYKVHSATKAKASYLKWQTRIACDINESLVEPGKVPHGPDLDPTNPFVASIRDVGPLAPVAQMFGRAIFDIKREHTAEASTTGGAYGGVVWQNWEDRKQEYRDEIRKIAEALS